MAILKKDKEEFKESSKKYKEKISEIDKEKKMLQSMLKKNAELDPYIKIKIAVLGIQKASINAEISILSQVIQNIRGDDYISNARKEIYGILMDFLAEKDIDFDSGFTDNQEFLQKISEMNPLQRYHFLKALYEITNKIYELELNGKYRWSFPEIYQKLSLVIFKFLDFKLYERAKNPDVPYHDAIHSHMELLIDVLQKSAFEYRSKYELVAQDLDSLQNLRKILELLKKIYNFIGDKAEEQRTGYALESTIEKIESILQKDKKTKEKKK
ncbi:MAG: hypothetical protein NZ853_02180 [Leptospiraceae bacterium]|nr:hypothetical protein [Leptospiraceae bacterium]MDW7975966.1 hypothetical protein [Leptospiraceae bacterium]